MSAKKDIVSCRTCTNFRSAKRFRGWSCHAIGGPGDKGPEFVGEWIFRMTPKNRDVYTAGRDPIPNDASSCPCFHHKLNQ
jgi:hypothetical protein